MLDNDRASFLMRYGQNETSIVLHSGALQKFQFGEILVHKAWYCKTADGLGTIRARLLPYKCFSIFTNSTTLAVD